MSFSTISNRSLCAEDADFQKKIPIVRFKHSVKNERKILKAFLLGSLHKLFCELFQNKMQLIQNNNSMECYAVDSQIIRFLIQEIVETGEYTLEGIAFHTRIPFDVVYDAVCGIASQFSITPWARIVDLYIQVKPEIARELTAKLSEVAGSNTSILSSLLAET